MLVYIDDREDEELNDSEHCDYGYDYGCEEKYEYDYSSDADSYEYVESSDSYFDE